MMLQTLKFPGYELTELIHEGVNTILYRGMTQRNAQPVILKVLKENYPTLDAIARLKHEYRMTENLDLDGVVKVYRLETYQNRLALVCEDFGGQSLKQLLSSVTSLLISKKGLEIKFFLTIAVQLAQALISLHQHQIIHKDIKPGNIIINPTSGIVKLTDFSIATRLGKETAQLTNPNALEGTLAYMSPEQTGRMNRAIDYRTDFYSLGVTFYEMLTGQLPFQSNDPLELVHCHLAKQPVSIVQLNPEVPDAIAQIVAKLMAKNAENRYQSAAGLKADLEYCRVQLETTGEIVNFTPGVRDRSAQLLIPQKLYGRQAEVATLLAAFERVAATGEQTISQSKIQNRSTERSPNASRRSLKSKIELMLVSGYSGIGKSSLVNEIHKPIVRQKGYFISGKFDQFKRNIPYASLIQAFQSLMRQLLTEDAAKLQKWREKLLAALGSNGQIIIDVIPEVELIIGKQPEVPQLGATESQNRFNRVFQEFIRVFSQKEHPLVIFLDDLQWADAASLKLMQLLITAPDSQYLLLIGAYRDNEVSHSHPLIQTIEEIQKAGTVINNIVVKPLNQTHVEQLIKDTLNETEKDTQELSSLLYNKTAGNPFFLTQMLNTLYQEKLLSFDFIKGGWKWNLKQIQAVGITDLSVVELMSRNISKLPPETQEILKLAACIGDRFKLDVLATTSEKPVWQVAGDLWSALQKGLILPLSNDYKVPLLFADAELKRFNFDDSKLEYRFLHDRVQQAAYSLIPASQKKAAHLKIGQLLLKNTQPNQLEDNIFDIVNQLNIGSEFIAHQDEKNELVQLNLIAGKKAKASSAYEAAVKYLNVGLELLAPDSWLYQYDLTLNLYVEATDAQYLNTNFDRANQLSTIVLSQAKTLLEKVPIYETKIQFYIAQNQMQSAIDTGLEVLQMLGYSLNAEPPIPLTIEQLLNLPEMQDPYQLAALRILNQIITPTFVAAPHLLQGVVLTMVNLSIQHGNSSLAAIGYVFYGMLLSGCMGDFDGGYQFGKLAERILDKFPNIELECRVYAPFNVIIRHWKEHIRETIIPLMEGAKIGLIAGNLEYASICSKDRCTHLFIIGEELEYVDAQFVNSLHLLREIKQEYSLYYAKIWRQLVLNLMGRVEDKSRLIGESFDEVEMLPYLIETNNRTSVFSAYLAKGILCYCFKDYAQSVENFELAVRYVEAAMGFATVGTLNFYQSLAMLALYPTAETCDSQSDAPKQNRVQILQQVEANQETMKQWAYHAPMNYQHKYHLVEAEKARVLTNKLEAIDYYDLAIKGAAENGYIQEEALAYELAGEFYQSLGKDIIAQAYSTKAYYAYIQWGAIAKVKDLESRYPYLVNCTKETTSKDITATTTSTTMGNAFSLDLSTVVKACQALSSEIVLERLLEKLIHLVAENAGAQKVFFIAKIDRQYVIEASLMSQENVTVLQSIPIGECDELPRTLINYVARTQTPLVLDDATGAEQFNRDPYIVANQPLSVLVSPVLHQGKLTGILYLENNLTRGAFTSDRLKVLGVLSAQAAISLENARFYTNLETRVAQRTQELQTALEELRRTQLQLIQSEKMSSLGQLVGGVAHEINNPINFIYGNLSHADDYAQSLLDLLHLYQEECPNPSTQLVDKIKTIDLEYIREDLPKILNSMHVGARRIRDIVQSLRNFARLDEAARKAVNLHEGLDSTLMVLQQKLGKIQVVKEYGNLPLINCYAGELNQVFMNLFANAIDALSHGVGSKVDSTQTPTIWLRTEVKAAKQVVIRIADNGVGINTEMLDKIFDPFFTTKPVGKGTGLGLSISYQIVVEQHRGELLCKSAPGEGTEFAIALPLASV